MREVILDTETTGFGGDDRIVELAAIELFDLRPTGETLHLQVNPERDVSPGALRVHGLTAGYLADKPLFAEVVGEFLEFIGESPLVAHNAAFDARFLNYELGRLGLPLIPGDRLVDTQGMARRRFPGQPCDLDALCGRLGVDLSARARHGALIDCALLAEVYPRLRGG